MEIKLIKKDMIGFCLVKLYPKAPSIALILKSVIVFKKLNRSILKFIIKSPYIILDYIMKCKIVYIVTK